MLAHVVVTTMLVVVLRFVPIGKVVEFLLCVIPCLIVKCSVLGGTFGKVGGGRMFSRGFLVTITAMNTVTITLCRGNSCARTVTIVLFCRVKRLFRDCTIKGDHGGVDRLVSVEPSCTGVRISKGLARISPSRITVNSMVIMRPKRGIPVSNIVIRNSSALGADTLANRDIPESTGYNSRVVDKYVGVSNILGVGAAGRFNRSAISGVLSLIRGSDSGGSGSRGFVSGFTGCCAPTIYCDTLTLTVLPPVIEVLFVSTTPR